VLAIARKKLHIKKDEYIQEEVEKDDASTRVTSAPQRVATSTMRSPKMPLQPRAAAEPPGPAE
ncbi:MAG: hypothetical protein R6V58_17805, partial [Planctomycetota bacterium]